MAAPINRKRKRLEDDDGITKKCRRRISVSSTTRVSVLMSEHDLRQMCGLYYDGSRQSDNVHNMATRLHGILEFRSNAGRNVLEQSLRLIAQMIQQTTSVPGGDGRPCANNWVHLLSTQCPITLTDDAGLTRQIRARKATIGMTIMRVITSAWMTMYARNVLDLPDIVLHANHEQGRDPHALVPQYKLIGCLTNSQTTFLSNSYVLSNLATNMGVSVITVSNHNGDQRTMSVPKVIASDNPAMQLVGRAVHSGYGFRLTHPDEDRVTNMTQEQANRVTMMGGVPVDMTVQSFLITPKNYTKSTRGPQPAGPPLLTVQQLRLLRYFGSSQVPGSDRRPGRAATTSKMPDAPVVPLVCSYADYRLSSMPLHDGNLNHVVTDCDSNAGQVMTCVRAMTCDVGVYLYELFETIMSMLNVHQPVYNESTLLPNIEAIILALTVLCGHNFNYRDFLDRVFQSDRVQNLIAQERDMWTRIGSFCDIDVRARPDRIPDVIAYNAQELADETSKITSAALDKPQGNLRPPASVVPSSSGGFQMPRLPSTQAGSTPGGGMAMHAVYRPDMFQAITLSQLFKPPMSQTVPPGLMLMSNVPAGSMPMGFISALRPPTLLSEYPPSRPIPSGVPLLGRSGKHSRLPTLTPYLMNPMLSVTPRPANNGSTT